MFNEVIAAIVVPSGVIFGSLATALLATGGLDQDERIFGVSISAVRELGSFGLIVVAVLGGLWIIKKGLEFAVPKFIEFLEATTSKFLLEQKTMREGFASEMKEERSLREKSLTDFREMLSAHRSSLGEKMDGVREAVEDGNKISEELVIQLKGRPCQK